MRTPPNERLSSDIADAARPRKPGPGKACAERKCIISSEVRPRDELIRLAISPEGLVLPDPVAKAPGRGAWLGSSRQELEKALDNGKFKAALARAFKDGGLTFPPDLADLIEQALTRTLLDRLGLEMRAGQVLLGSEKIAQSARKGDVALLLHASDASEDGSKKLDQAWRVGRDAEGTGGRGMSLPLDRAALSVALGRDNVVHLALASPASAERVNSVLRRLMQFRGEESPSPDPATDAVLPL